MKNRIYLLNSVIIAALLLLNFVCLKNAFQQHKRYGLIARRFRFIYPIKPQLAELENKLWGIISVYDPSQGRKVSLDELKYQELISKMMNSIDAAAVLAKDARLALQLDILKRSVKSLSKRIDTIKDRIEMKKMDEESARMLFPGTKQLYLLSESYIDELKALLEQIRLVRRVIEGNISNYEEIEIEGLDSENETVAKINQRWLLINIICVIGVGILLLLLFKAIARESSVL